MKKISIVLLSVILLTLSFHGSIADSKPSGPYAFQEVWGYLMKGEESYLNDKMPFTDIGYFSAQVNEQGRIPMDITRPDLSTHFKKPHRIHLVISTVWNKTIMNFILRRDFPLRNQLLNDIVTLSKGFDGLQIDFESINYEDKEYYISFLQELKQRLPKTMIFSVAVPARWWTKENPFDYEEIAKIADRIVVMAYDEHWRSGPAGPIASMPWCQKVLDFSKKYIPPQKLVMGAPLYGRSWQKEIHAKAFRHNETMTLCQNQNCVMKRTESGTPFFEYTDTVTIAVHFEDLDTLAEKISVYHGAAIRHMAFWRIGQEPKGAWEMIENQCRVTSDR